MWSTWSSPSVSWVMSRTERSWVACSRSAVSARRAGRRRRRRSAAGGGAPAGADRGSPAAGKGPDPGQQPGTGRGVLELPVGGAGPGQGQVVADGGVEQVRVLRAPADDRPHVVGR